jgi:hypothetical protein
MVVVVDIGIEIRAARLDHDLAHQSGGGELMQGVVDCGERDPDGSRDGLAMELFGGDVAVGDIEQELRQRDTLPGRPEPDLAQALDDHWRRALQLHLPDIGRNKTKIKRGRCFGANQLPVCRRSTSSRTVGT